LINELLKNSDFQNGRAILIHHLLENKKRAVDAQLTSITLSAAEYP
jgi:hypothetical protein